MALAMPHNALFPFHLGYHTVDPEKAALVDSIQKRWGDSFTRYIPSHLWHVGPPLRSDLSYGGPSTRADASGLYWPLDVLLRLDELSTFELTWTRPDWIREVIDRIARSRNPHNDRTALQAADIAEACEEMLHHTAPLDSQSQIPLDPISFKPRDRHLMIPCNTPIPNNCPIIVVDVNRPSCMVFQWNKMALRISSKTVRHPPSAHHHRTIRVSTPTTTRSWIRPRQQMSLNSARTMAGITVHTAKTG
jgi:hypothetical protein